LRALAGLGIYVFICQEFADFSAKILIFDELLAFW
jgi:hypothetical protein